MSSEERSAWILGVVAVGGLITYLVIVLGAAQAVPLTEVDYVPIMLWIIGGGIVIAILVTIVSGILARAESGKKDQRDVEIYRAGERIGQSFLVIGGTAAMLLAMFEFDYFWIANTLYLAFVLSAIVSCTARVIAYRRGFLGW